MTIEASDILSKTITRISDWHSGATKKWKEKRGKLKDRKKSEKTEARERKRENDTYAVSAVLVDRPSFCGASCVHVYKP
jgi:hypothetical protein